MAKKYIKFVKEFGNWIIYHKRKEQMLGKLYYYPQWSQWVFEPGHDTIWSQDCLNQIEEMLKDLND